MIYLAKTNPVETLREHTDNVLKEFYVLKTNYRKQIDKLVEPYMEAEDFWNMLKLCCEYHDYGKANGKFQNKLRNKLEMDKVKEIEGDEVPHNYLSVAFLPGDILDFYYEKYGEDMEIVIFHAIAYHHERETTPDSNLIKSTVKKDLELNMSSIGKHMGVKIDETFSNYVGSIQYSGREKLESTNKYFNIYILLKGLLHKIDHAASAHCTIEDETGNSVAKATEAYKNKKGWQWRGPQIYAKNHRDDNLVIVASTGIGKTETALLWIDDDKGFFTLPLRVSINALFDRVKEEIGFNNVGLIHSTALDHLLENEYEESSKIYEEAKLLSSKLSFSTIDQIFKYPFKYKGYEKVLATLAYSKVVIDEIQAYSPQITAVILYALKQLHDMGGKFLVMTATLPRIYKDKLKEFGIEFKEEHFISDMRRHKINLRNEKIVDALDEIKKIGQKSKVLVIVNTVDKALEVYKGLNGESNEDIKLLHSMFINGDRARLEGKIKAFTDAENHDSGIWITTQIVEASLDIDFDYLYTEMSTLDSQFQRYGRCYRKRNFHKEDANVIIFTEDISGAGSIYDEDILALSIKMLKPYNNQILEEEVKVELVDKLYSKENLRGTKFLAAFNKACGDLDNMTGFEKSNADAQKALREIESYRVIPLDIYNENIGLFDEYVSAKGEERKRLMLDIGKLTVNLPDYKVNKYKRKGVDISLQAVPEINNLYTINVAYSNKIGILLDEFSDNMF